MKSSVVSANFHGSTLYFRYEYEHSSAAQYARKAVKVLNIYRAKQMETLKVIDISKHIHTEPNDTDFDTIKVKQRAEPGIGRQLN